VIYLTGISRDLGVVHNLPDEEWALTTNSHILTDGCEAVTPFVRERQLRQCARFLNGTG
jgi:hypothetical protein